jgi:hypothetical protein
MKDESKVMIIAQHGKPSLSISESWNPCAMTWMLKSISWYSESPCHAMIRRSGGSGFGYVDWWKYRKILNPNVDYMQMMIQPFLSQCIQTCLKLPSSRFNSGFDPSHAAVSLQFFIIIATWLFQNPSGVSPLPQPTPNNSFYLYPRMCWHVLFADLVTCFNIAQFRPL